MKSNITIVGPQSEDDDSGSGGAEAKDFSGVGAGLSSVLMMAASDENFRQRLL